MHINPLTILLEYSCDASRTAASQLNSLLRMSDGVSCQYLTTRAVIEWRNLS